MQHRVVVVGAGPAGLIAAETLARAGHRVAVFDRMPSAGRKLLLAGRGGLNLTHTEALPDFLARYAEAVPLMSAALAVLSPAGLRAWCEGLGQPVFAGSSGRVFPMAFKAAPLLRAWLGRLDALGVILSTRHRWMGWAGTSEDLSFETPDGERIVRADAVLLALGGASWPRMGSDGGWVPLLRRRGIAVTDLRPSNCGAIVLWSPIFLARFEGQPLKRIAISAGGQSVRGEAVVTRNGLEGGAVYALSASLRAALDRDGKASITIDLRPDLDLAALSARIDGPRGGRSLSNFLRQAGGLSAVAIGLVQDALHAGNAQAQLRLSALVKGLELPVRGLQPIERAISSAGGVAASELDENLMIRSLPGVFVAGEMLDWEAPTGGYLLQGCFSTGMLAAEGMRTWLAAAHRADRS